MTPVFPARRAEEFDRLVEELSTGRPDGARPEASGDTRTAELLGVVTALRTVEPVAPRPAFSAALREQLMEAADGVLVKDDAVRRLTLPPRRRTRDRRIAVLVGAAAILGASTSVAVAAQSALPGEMLYPVKRLIEDAGTGAQLSDDARGVSLLDHATDRLSEVTELLRTGDLREGPEVESTLITFSDQSLEATDLILGDYAETGDASSVEELRDFAATSLDTLAQLEALLPDEAKDELQYAAEVLAEIDAAAARACPSCSGGITQVPPALVSAGEVGEPSLVETVPAPVVAAEQPPRDTRRGGDRGSGGGQDAGGSETTAGAGPLVPTEPITGGGTGGDTSTGPIEQLADSLTGGGTGGNASTGGGKTGVDPLDDVLDSVEGTVDGTVDGLLD